MIRKALYVIIIGLILVFCGCGGGGGDSELENQLAYEEEYLNYPLAEARWEITEKDSMLHINYGTDQDNEDWATLDLKTGKFTPRYFPNGPTEAEIVIFPSIKVDEDVVYEGVASSYSYEIDGYWCFLTVEGETGEKKFKIRIGLNPPPKNYTNLLLEVEIEDTASNINSSNEVFQPVKLISEAQDVSTFVDDTNYLVENGLFLKETLGDTFGLVSKNQTISIYFHYTYYISGHMNQALNILAYDYAIRDSYVFNIEIKPKQ